MMTLTTRIVQGSRMAEIEAGTFFRLSYPEELAKVSFEAGTWRLTPDDRLCGLVVDFQGGGEAADSN